MAKNDFSSEVVVQGGVSKPDCQNEGLQSFYSEIESDEATTEPPTGWMNYIN